ncbi:MAG: T9SS type A sorting domain-containing protein [Rhodothermales bacterium]
MKRYLLLLLWVCAAGPLPGFAQTSVFINEIHYDNTGADIDEAIEIAGPSGTDLSGWSLVLYNGSGGAAYDTQNLSGVIPDLGGGFGVVTVTYPSNGLQNGSPDGIVLYDGASVVQFLSYEGSFTAVGGVADGLTSTDIGVSESSGPLGESLQLGGTGSTAEDFVWEASQANTFGAFNANQIFNGDGGPPTPPNVVINEVDADQTSTDNAEFVELFAAPNTDLSGLALVLFNGSNDQAYQAFDLDGFATDADGYFVVCGDAVNVPNCDLDVSPNTDLIQNGADAVALYQADASAFPNGTPVTVENLIDALVYDTDDADDLELLALLNAGEPQVNENGNGAKDTESMQRIPNGSGGARNTAAFTTLPPTPGAINEAPAPDVSVVINEVDSDQTSGDTAEFVELFADPATDLSGLVLVFYNGSNDQSYQAFDLDGFATDADGYFVLCANAATVANCDLDVTPDTDLIQNGADAIALFVGDASAFPNGTPVTTVNLVDAVVYDTDDADDAGLLVLLNAGEAQVNENASGSKDTQSIQRIPNGSGGGRNTSTYSLFDPTPGAENGVVPFAGTFEIYALQGAGLTSPYAGFRVATENNVVTALSTNGFFIQTPADRSDNDPATSDGLFVFTGSAPTVSVGDLVSVTGSLVEFFEFTEFTDDPVVTVLGSGAPVPDPVVFDGATPSPDQPQDANAYERYEGMRVTVANGLVSGPSQSFGTDPEAEAFVVASGQLPFREKGIVYPGLSGLPVWDGNPEVFELDPDKLGLDNQILTVGSTFQATGVIGFEFGDYELWPTELTVTPAPLPIPVRAAEAGEATVGSLNLFRLFDDIKDGTEDTVPLDEYQTRLAKFSIYIRDVLGAPDILAVEEVEKLGVLQALAARIQADDPTLAYDAYLVEGNDVGGIDVGFLVKPARVQVNAVTQLGATETLSVDGSLLHDRPPLLLEADFLAYGLPAFPIEAMVVHNRSLNGIEDPGSGGDRVRQKRLEQALSIATMIQDRQTANPDVRLVVLGDFNAFEFTDGYVDAVGIIRGSFDPSESLLSGADLVEPDLTNQVLTVPAENRYSFVNQGSPQVLDHALTSAGLDPFVTGFSYGRGNAGAPLVLIDDPSNALRSSDHDGLVVFIQAQEPFQATAVLAARNSMYLDSGVHVASGDVLVRDDATDATLAGAELVLDRKVITAAGYQMKANEIVILPNSVVKSDVTFNTLTNAGTITGTQTSPLALPAFAFPPFPAIDAGGDDLIVGSNQTVTLAPGSYGDITVRSNGTLVLAGGLYQVSSVTLASNANLRYSSAAELRVDGVFTASQTVNVTPASGATVDASDFVIFAAGANGTTSTAVDFGHFSTISASIYAPNGTIEFFGNSTATGAFLARDIEVGRNTTVQLDNHWAVETLAPVVAARAGQDAPALLLQTAAELPEAYGLGANYPNPFNPVTVIPFSLPEASHVSLVVYDLLGRKVETLVDRAMEPGFHQARFDAGALPSGAYLYRIEAGSFVRTGKMMLVK